jgi:hypothetical protein
MTRSAPDRNPSADPGGGFRGSLNDNATRNKDPTALVVATADSPAADRPVRQSGEQLHQPSPTIALGDFASEAGLIT